MAPRRQDLTGQVFTKLTALRVSSKSKPGITYWICKCECGKLHTATLGHLKAGNIQSCGCLKAEANAKTHTKHGDTKYKHLQTKASKKIYRTWNGMKNRCLSKTNKDYPRYGGRGITIYEPWIKDYKKFRRHVLSLPGAPDNDYKGDVTVTIDRKDNNKGYIPGNLRWRSMKEQSDNRSTGKRYVYKNKARSIREIADKTGLPYKLISDRIRRGCSAEEAVKAGKPDKTRKLKP